MENLRQLRLDKGMTQVEVAKLAGVATNSYRNWENGSVKPNPENLIMLKAILGVGESGNVIDSMSKKINDMESELKRMKQIIKKIKEDK